MAPIGIEPITHGLQGKKNIAVRITIMIHRSYVALPVELWGHIDIKKSDALVATSDPGKEFRLLRQAEKNQGKRPALIFTEGATEVSGSWQILSGGPPHSNGHRSAGATEYGTSTAGFALSRFMRHALRVIYQFDASALLPRQNAVRPVPVGRSLVRCMALNHLSSFQDA